MKRILVFLFCPKFQNLKFPVYRSVRGALRTPEYQYYRETSRKLTKHRKVKVHFAKLCEQSKSPLCETLRKLTKLRKVKIIFFFFICKNFFFFFFFGKATRFKKPRVLKRNAFQINAHLAKFCNGAAYEVRLRPFGANSGRRHGTSGS